MPPRLPATLALVLGLLCFGLAACGEDDQGLLNAGRAERLQDDLDAIDRFVGEGRCDAAEGRLDSLTAKVRDLPQSTDRQLKARLEEGVATLREQLPGDCEEPTETQPETTPETTPTVPEETVQPETVPPETVPPETVPPETVPPETVPPQTTPPEEVPDEGSGGEEAPLGEVIE